MPTCPPYYLHTYLPNIPGRYLVDTNVSASLSLHFRCCPPPLYPQVDHPKPGLCIAIVGIGMRDMKARQGAGVTREYLGLCSVLLPLPPLQFKNQDRCPFFGTCIFAFFCRFLLKAFGSGKDGDTSLSEALLSQIHASENTFATQETC